MDFSLDGSGHSQNIVLLYIHATVLLYAIGLSAGSVLIYNQGFLLLVVLMICP